MELARLNCIESQLKTLYRIDSAFAQLLIVDFHCFSALGFLIFERSIAHMLITHHCALNTSKRSSLFRMVFFPADDTLLFKSRPLLTLVFTYVNRRSPSHRERLNFSIRLSRTFAEIQGKSWRFSGFVWGDLPQFPSAGGWSSVRSNYRLICTDPLFSVSLYVRYARKTYIITVFSSRRWQNTNFEPER